MILPDLADLAVDIATLSLLPGNPRVGDVDAVAASLAAFGQRKPIVAKRDGTVVAGNHTLQAARQLGWSEIAVVWVDDDDTTAKAFALADNRTAELGGYDDAALEAMVRDVLEFDAELLADIGWAGEELEALLDGLALADSLLEAPEATPPFDPVTPEQREQAERVLLRDRFVVPPFSVLNVTRGYWQDRKREWLSLGIHSEEGRAHNLLKMSDTVLAAGARKDAAPNRSTPASHSGNDPAYYWKKQEAEKVAGRPLTNAEFEADYFTADAYDGGTSIFDPVLCEIAYRWFSPPDGRVLDPFAGGSVRGIVAAMLGRSYTGVELRPEQIASNVEQAQQIVTDAHPAPRWFEGDATALPDEVGSDHDLVFSCPPYHDLEQYSDDPRDLSAMPWDEFLDAYRRAIAGAVDRLADNRFAVWVIGEVRAPSGSCRGLVPATVQAFEDAGAALHNDAVLVTPTGSLALRAARIFVPGRRLGRSHQYVLVFVKGNAEKAVEACGSLADLDLALPTTALEGD